jgi:tRNA threonylcarbamoyladenosine biosynthesis protein TsaB
VALLLSFDTATPYLGVVLSEDARPLAWREDVGARLTHAEHLNVFIEGVMKQAGRSLKELEAVAVGIGPGSYTGLRIGLSAAKGLCFALDAPLIGMGTLDVLLAEFMHEKRVLQPGDTVVPMVDARRMEVYARTYGHDLRPRSNAAPLVLDAGWCMAMTGRTFVFGDGADKATALWDPSPTIAHVPGIRPAVHGLARCAAEHFAKGAFSDLAYLVPEYGKPANVARPHGTGPG